MEGVLRYCFLFSEKGRNPDLNVADIIPQIFLLGGEGLGNFIT